MYIYKEKYKRQKEAIVKIQAGHYYKIFVIIIVIDSKIIILLLKNYLYFNILLFK